MLSRIGMSYIKEIGKGGCFWVEVGEWSKYHRTQSFMRWQQIVANVVQDVDNLVSIQVPARNHLLDILHDLENIAVGHGFVLLGESRISID